MDLSCALVASNGRPEYLSYWPLVRQAWTEIVGVPVVLVLVACDMPVELAGDPQVVRVDPLPGVATALQAQVIRLLAPAATGVGGAVVISDMDMVPMSRRYFHRPVQSASAHDLIVFRDRPQLSMCYIAAEPRIWAATFGVGEPTWFGVRERLAQLTSSVEYDDTRGGAGWFTDQVVLTELVARREAQGGRVVRWSDADTDFCRLDRSRGIDALAQISWRTRLNIARRRFTDFHMLANDGGGAAANDRIVTTAAKWSRRRSTVRSIRGPK